MGNAASSLPYTIGKAVPSSPPRTDGWAVHEGKVKADGSAVTVFVAKKPLLAKTPCDRSRHPQMTQFIPAWHHFVHCKKLRHPQILQVYATLDTDNPQDSTSASAGNTATTTTNNTTSSGGAALSSSSSGTATPAAAETGDLIIVTEPCVFLEAWLQTAPPPEQLAWGLESMVRALHFMHTQAHLSHGNLSPASFCVTPAGDVKLWNFSLVTTVETEYGGLSRHFIEWEGLVTPPAYRSPERAEGRWDAISTAGVHVMDSFGLGVLIHDLFRGQIPPPLLKAVQRLQTTQVRMRPRLQPLLKCPIFDTPYQKLQWQLEEWTVQPVEQKIAFWQNLTPTLQAGLIPPALAVHKLLRMIKLSIDTICQSDSMKSQDMYRREVLSTLPPMFFIAENYLGDKVAAELTRTIGTLFTVNDRAIRGTLLQKVGFLSQHLDKNTLNQSVFEPTCSGFSDSSAALRELTLKATLEMVPSLTAPNVEKLSRYLVRLQSDSEASIRTNTVLFFSKLAPHLTEVSREKLLLPAFIRAMKDPFMHCRLAALKSTYKAKEFFSPPVMATQVLPAVSSQLLDVAPEVRREAFLVVDDFLFILRQESERMNSLPAPAPAGAAPTAPAKTGPVVAKDTPGAKTAVAPAPNSGGYLSGISSWMSTSAKPQPAPAASVPTPAAPAMVAPQQQARPRPPDLSTLAVSNHHHHQQGALNAATAYGGGDDNNNNHDDGWDDPDDDLLDLSGSGTKGSAAAPLAPKSLIAPAPLMPSHHKDDDDFFGGFDSKPAKPVSLPKASGKLVVPAAKPVSKPAPAVTKLAADDLEDGWDDF